MHFRDLVVIGLTVGAAFLLPTDTFAEKNEPAEHLNVVKEVTSSQDLKPGSTKPLQKNKGETNQQPTSNHHSQKVEVPLPAEKAVKSLDKTGNKVQNAVQIPEQVSGKVKNIGKSADESVSKNTLPVNEDSKQEQSQGKKRQSSKRESDSIIKEVGKHSKDASKRTLQSIEPSEKAIGPDKHKVSLSEKSTSKKEENTPAGHNRYPENFHDMTSPQSPNKGSSSKDRTGNGQSTSNSFEKWVEIGDYLDWKPIQPYGSKAKVYYHQWGNAPPLPPPKTGLFLRC